MPESFLDIFEQLKPERPPPIKAEVKELFFQLNFDSSTKAYISILDETRNEVSDFDYRFYDEPVRSLIKAVSNIKTHQNFEISWELTGSGIYLSGNEFLLELLKPCNNFITDQFKSFQLLFYWGMHLAEVPTRCSVMVIWRTTLKHWPNLKTGLQQIAPAVSTYLHCVGKTVFHARNVEKNA